MGYSGVFKANVRYGCSFSILPGVIIVQVVDGGGFF
jgi:hypothetical protein